WAAPPAEGSIARRAPLSLAPQQPIFDAQRLLHLGNLLLEAPRVPRITGRGTQLRQVTSPIGIEGVHRKFPQVLGNHRGQRRRQGAFAAGPELRFAAGFLRAPTIDARLS